MVLKIVADAVDRQGHFERIFEMKMDYALMKSIEAVCEDGGSLRKRNTRAVIDLIAASSPSSASEFQENLHGWDDNAVIIFYSGR